MKPSPTFEEEHAEEMGDSSEETPDLFHELDNPPSPEA